MTTLHAHLPQDRLRALARHETLPDRTHGSALFADISGFTPLTEALRSALGPRRGAEALTQQLEAIFTALIAEVENYGGSVIGFAGDACTCWFDDAPSPAAPRATACALALQRAMQAFQTVPLPNRTTTTLTLKVAVASGPARRLAVGDAEIQLFDVLAGETLARMANGEHVAHKGEVLLDETTAHALGDTLVIREWRRTENGECFVVAASMSNGDHSLPTTLPQYSPEQLRAWIPTWVYARESAGQQALLNEFRAVTFVFLRFMGIDYDAESALAHLNTYMQWVLRVVRQADGYLRAPSIGDKGSYLLIALGAPTAHEDDMRRALRVALALRTPPADCAFITSTQIGLATGVVWAGLCGGDARHAYDFVGDDANLAARLMQAAAPGEILVSGQVQAKLAETFTFGPERLLHLKGKTGLFPVFAAHRESEQRGLHLQEPAYSLPMVGRQTELEIIGEKLDLAVRGKAQLIGIVAEAGVGKSRLAAEVIRLARRKGFTAYGGGCQADGVNTPYLAWKPIWSAFFNVNPALPLPQQIHRLEHELKNRAPERLPALPLLSILLNLLIPDNEFTKTLEPKYRQSALRALLEDCLRAAAKATPVLVIIEDLHWIDALSHDLLEELAQAVTDSSVCFVMAYRPPQLAPVAGPRLEQMANFTRIALSELNAAEASQAIHAKLAQLYPESSGAVPSRLVEKLMARAQGNPFFLEELLNFLHDHQLDPRDPPTLEKIELPDNLYTLILSRIDQLNEREKLALRAASIIGRLFHATWLIGYYPDLGELPRVKTDLEQLARLDITPLDTPEPELAYLFKHIVTHEVTYESLPFAMRAKLHEQLARYLETLVPPPVDTIAHHYGRSDNTAKKREYYQKAAQAALSVSAFTTAVEYYARLLELAPNEDPARSALALQLAEAHKCLGDYPTARAAIAQAQAAATTDTDRASALALLGEMMSETGDYAQAQTILTQAVPLARASGDQLALCRALYALGDVNWRLDKLGDAKVALDESLGLARELNHLTCELFALIRLGALAGNAAEEDQLHREVYQRAQAVGNRERMMVALNHLGVVAYERQDFVASRGYQTRALTIAREIGAQQDIALLLINLANKDTQLGQFAEARNKLQEGLALALRLGAVPWVVGAVTHFAKLARAEGKTPHALALLGLARTQPAWSSGNQRALEMLLSQWALDPAVVEAGLKKGEALEWEATVEGLLSAL